MRPDGGRAWLAHVPYCLLLAGAIGVCVVLRSRAALAQVSDVLPDRALTLPLGLAFATSWLGYVGATLSQRRPAPRPVAAYAVAVLLVFVLTPVSLSIDVLDYIRRGRILSVYGANPHLVTAMSFPGDAFYSDVGWTFLTTPYGPVFTGLSAALTRLAGESSLFNILGFKLLMTAAHVVNFVLIRRITGRTAAGLLYLLNPFVLLEVVANAHNDVLPATAVLGALLCLQRGAPLLSVLLLSVAACIKLPFVLLLPIWLRHAAASGRGRSETHAVGLFHGWNTALVGTMASAAIAFILWWPVYGGPTTFHIYRLHASLMTKWSLPGLLRDLLMRAGVPDAALVAGMVCAAVAAAAALPAVWRARDFQHTARAFATVLLLLPLVAMGWLLPWYLVWPLALLPVVPGRAWTMATIALTGAGLAHYVLQTWLAFDSSVAANVALGLTTIAPPFLALVLWRGSRVLPARHAETPRE